MKIFSTEQLYKADTLTVKNEDISSTNLMERAGVLVYNWLHQKLKGGQVPIHIFCGIGNNGGDGLVIGRHLIASGYNVHTYVVNYSDKRSKDFLINYDRIKNMGKNWPTLMSSKDDFPKINSEDIIVDAIFGIGISRSPRSWVKGLIQYLNKSEAYTLSIDMPSGLYPNKAVEDPEAIIISDSTLTFQSAKLSFFLPETAKYVPYFSILDIGLDANYLNSEKPLAETYHSNDAIDDYLMREKFDHKGTYGHSLVIGGSYGKIGAVILAAKAALRVGSGLVTVYVPKCGYEIIQTALPEAMVVTDSSNDHIRDISLTIDPTVIGIGIGMGTNGETIDALKNLFKQTKSPLVIDADALNCISEDKELLRSLPKRTILTPHPGELERLIGPWKNDYEKIEKVKSFSTEYDVIIVIKGAHTISIDNENMFINTSGNPGMATAGSGDVLTGMITGLMSQGYEPLKAALFGVYLHGSSGDISSKYQGLEGIIASDIVENIGNAYMDLFRPEEQNNIGDEKKESSN